MSILIKDTDIRAGDIIVAANIDGKLKATLPVSHGDRKWHDVVEIHTPHGDLIDKQKLIKVLEKRWNVDDDSEFANKSVWRELEKNAPTIIEKEY